MHFYLIFDYSVGVQRVKLRPKLAPPKLNIKKVDPLAPKLKMLHEILSPREVKKQSLMANKRAQLMNMTYSNLNHPLNNELE